MEAESLYKTNTVINVKRIENMWSGVKRTMQETWPVLPPRKIDEQWDLVSDAWDEVASSQRLHSITDWVHDTTNEISGRSRRVLYCTTSFNIQKFCVLPTKHLLCFAWISEQTAIISLYNINLSVFITEAESVYCAVRTGSLNQTAAFSSSKVKTASVV